MRSFVCTEVYTFCLHHESASDRRQQRRYYDDLAAQVGHSISDIRKKVYASNEKIHFPVAGYGF
jgi:hypothetical protein